MQMLMRALTQVIPDQQFPIEIGWLQHKHSYPTADDEPCLSEVAATVGEWLLHIIVSFCRSRELDTHHLELFPPLMSYEESHAKSPSLHGGGGYLTDEEQV